MMSAAAVANWICDTEGNYTCACSTSGDECCCIGERVCDGPLVGAVVEQEIECRSCGSPMVAIDVNTGERLVPQPEWRP